MAADVVRADSPAEGAAPAMTGRGAAALKAAAKDNKYLFIFFWREDTQRSREMRGVFQAAMAKMTDKAEAVEIQSRRPGRGADRGPLRRQPLADAAWSWPSPPTGPSPRAFLRPSTPTNFARRSSALARPSA